MTEPLPFVLRRYSPLRFDRAHEIGTAEVDVLLEAARRAPSAGNSQPWSFVVGRRGDRVHRRLAHALAPSSARWAVDASLLVANLSRQRAAGSELQYSEFAHYDLGQAVAHLTFQADALGLMVHQFRAFDRHLIATAFDVPAHWEVTSMCAVGRPLDAYDDLTGGSTSRERRTLEEIVWARD